MNDKKLFSAFYSTDIEVHEDKIKFRNRILGHVLNLRPLIKQKMVN